MPSTFNLNLCSTNKEVDSKNHCQKYVNMYKFITFISIHWGYKNVYLSSPMFFAVGMEQQSSGRWLNVHKFILFVKAKKLTMPYVSSQRRTKWKKDPAVLFQKKYEVYSFCVFSEHELINWDRGGGGEGGLPVPFFYLLGEIDLIL